MFHPTFRARCFAPLALLILAACGSQPDIEARLQARQGALDPPRLWRVTAGADELLVCADGTMRDGFRRATPEINGRFCQPFNDHVDRPGLFAVRCEIDGRRYGVTVNSHGDLERDFTAAFSLAALDGSGVTARQARRYRAVGPCPPGWGIGDQARAGGQRSSSLSGVWPAP